MGEVPGFSSDHDYKPTLDEEFIADGYEPEVVVSSTVGVYTIWSKIRTNGQTDESQTS